MEQTDFQAHFIVRSDVVTERGDQLHQVVGSPPLQRLQRLDHLQTVAHTSTNRTVHTAKHRPRTHAQAVSYSHLNTPLLPSSAVCTTRLSQTPQCEQFDEYPAEMM